MHFRWRIIRQFEMNFPSLDRTCVPVCTSLTPGSSRFGTRFSILIRMTTRGLQNSSKGQVKPETSREIPLDNQAFGTREIPI